MPWIVEEERPIASDRLELVTLGKGRPAVELGDDVVPALLIGLMLTMVARPLSVVLSLDIGNATTLDIARIGFAD